MAKIWLSDELAEAGKKVIAECHKPLEGLKIAWFFRDKASKSGGKVTLGRAIAVQDRDWLLHRHDVIIEIAQDFGWQIADDRARTALLDHELSHILWDGSLDDESGRPLVVLIGHDIEEFASVLRRRGCWHPGLKGFLRAGADHRAEYEAD